MNVFIYPWFSTWVVSDFESECSKGPASENSWRSPTYAVGHLDELEVDIRMYFSRGTEDTEDYLTMGIDLVSSRPRLVGHFKISLVNMHGQETEYVSEDVVAKLHPGMSETFFTLLVTRSDLLNPEKHWLQDGKLTVKWTMCLFASMGISQPRSRNYIPVDMPLSCDLGQLLGNKTFSDAKLIVDNNEIPVHKAILAARSNKFNDIFTYMTEQQQENGIEITDVTDNMMRKLLHYIYTGRIDQFYGTRVGEVSSAADKYALRGLQKICEEKMDRGSLYW